MRGRQGLKHKVFGMSRITLFSVAAAALSAGLLLSSASHGQEAPQSPENVAIVDEGAAGFSVRHFPTRLHLYTFSRDSPTASACIDGCASRWPPVRAKAGSTPVGDWTLVQRTDGDPQWAYKGSPVYLLYHDSPDSPGGEGAENGAWRMIQNIPKIAPPPQ